MAYFEERKDVLYINKHKRSIKERLCLIEKKIDIITQKLNKIK